MEQAQGSIREAWLVATGKPLESRNAICAGHAAKGAGIKSISMDSGAIEA